MAYYIREKNYGRIIFESSFKYVNFVSTAQVYRNFKFPDVWYIFLYGSIVAQSKFQFLDNPRRNC